MTGKVLYLGDDNLMCAASYPAGVIQAAGESGVMVTSERKPGEKYACGTGSIPLSEAASKTKPLQEYVKLACRKVTL